MPHPSRNRFWHRAFPLLLGLLVTACGADCTEVCHKHQDCMGRAAGILEGCISQCESRNFDGKDDALQCIADSSCAEIRGGACAPSCAEVCARAIACEVATDALCSTTCKSLSYAQQECYIVNDCSVVRDSCTGLSTTTP